MSNKPERLRDLNVTERGAPKSKRRWERGGNVVFLDDERTLMLPQGAGAPSAPTPLAHGLSTTLPLGTHHKPVITHPPPPSARALAAAVGVGNTITVKATADAAASAAELTQTPVAHEVTPEAEAPKPAAMGMALNKLIVSAYKAMGFTILTAILLGLAAYIGINLFYLGNRSWMAPTILSPTDPKVIQLNAEAASQEALKDKLAADRREMVARLVEAEATATMEDQFQDAFREAMKADLADGKAALAKYQGAAGAYGAARGQIAQSNRAYTNLSRERMGELAKAHLIDQDGIVNGNYQLAQIATTNVGLAQRSVELDTRISELKRSVDSLNNAANAATGKGAGGVYAYEILKQKHEYDQSVVNAERANAERDALKASIDAIDETGARYDHLVNAIRNSPYLKALSHDMTVAFVPYDNADNVHNGDVIYGCKLSILWCKKIGVVANVLDGEVLGKHPLHSDEIRGVFVQMELEDPANARDTVVHVGRAPLFI